METDADYAALHPDARAVLDFWFGEPGMPAFGMPSKRWFKRDDAFDALILERFGETLERARRGECDAWLRTPLGALALIVVLDQFSRNTCRGRADAFAYDAYALAAARRLVGIGAHHDLPSPEHRAFAFLPFEHSESEAAQRESVRLFEALSREMGSTGKGGYYDYACRHAAVIERFGRFPHRNAALGRESTDEELAFLREPGSSF
ncbi:DUF924 domain-containing protein [Trinickia dinghuensis]|uniref:DUF924 domain-containing protein n=2 Tax=Trinickia dinghuensis TaxID=2291023 RepID=A0A3D8JV63_9BURK|nr:DUF924 domain-containing protein [Trinickia dinghuensis]